jgi:hypothetical protein
MNKDRISNLTKTKDGKECLKIKQRRKWVTYLRKHLISIPISDPKKKKIIQWVNNTIIDKNDVQKIIDDISWRQSDMLNY